MIFYFTGTGNSLMAAKALALEGETLVNMATARKAKEFAYQTKGERVGFVFPVYCYTLPDVVLDFVRELSVDECGYAFAVVTCGGSIGGTAKYLSNELKKRGIDLLYATSLLVPDNAVFFYNIKPKEETDARLDRAKQRLAAIKEELAAEKVERAKGLSARFLRPMYHLLAGTKAFSVTDACIACGMCARNCPDGAIEMKDGAPVWVKSRCTKCSACINRCPKAAIQYGKGSAKRLRYVNPVLKGGE